MKLTLFKNRKNILKFSKSNDFIVKNNSDSEINKIFKFLYIFKINYTFERSVK